MTSASDHREFLLAIADDKHFIGQQYAEWIGVAPFLEEDLAFCSIGQDELGHAAAIYEMLSADDDQAIDKLAFDRPVEEYRSSVFVEIVTKVWPEALVRHWMFDTADALRWRLLANSSISELAELAVRVEAEESYHRLHANSLLELLLADDVARAHISAAVAVMAPLSLGLFEPVAGEAAAVDAGVASGAMADTVGEYRAQAESLFGDINWGTAPDQALRTVRSDDFAPLLARMREVLDFDPQATW